MGEPMFGQCPHCGGVMGMGHTCFPPRQVYGQASFTPNPLTEADIRRIIREELERARAADQPTAATSALGLARDMILESSIPAGEMVRLSLTVQTLPGGRIRTAEGVLIEVVTDQYRAAGPAATTP